MGATEIQVRPYEERFYRDISFVLRDKQINPKWKSLGQLLDALASYKDERFDDVIIFLCQLMNLTSDTNRSTFINAFFDYHNLPFAHINIHNGSTTDKPVSKPLPRLGNKQRKPKTR